MGDATMAARPNIVDVLRRGSLMLGTMRLTDAGVTSPEAVADLIQTAVELGITTLDLADIYGGYTTERIVGDALRLRPELRDEIHLVSKCGIVAPVGRHGSARVKHYDTSRHHIETSVDASLDALGADHLDLLLIHRPDPLMDAEATGAVLDNLVDDGRVGAVGVSNFRPWDWSLLQSAMDSPLVANQIELSLAHLNPFSNGDVAFHQQHNHGLMAWSPLGGGRVMNDAGTLGQRLDVLAESNGVGRSAIAAAFLLHHPASISPVLGTTSSERLSEVAMATTVKLDTQDWFWLYEAGLGSEVP